MKHFSEEELIAYQLQESSDEVAISRHLEGCSECANLSESIAETLRVFSADPFRFRSGEKLAAASRQFERTYS